ncbi:MAG TPA: cysteine hydrolase [Acetobacteraceae bacterium]|nr:cysteine hydrolase [Acetobacteraceae bacterium]
MSIRFGRLGESAAHLCIDMQTVFAERTDWHVPWMQRVLPTVQRIAEARSERTIFTRFVPPNDPEQMPGSWQRYYRRWRHMTGERIDPAMIELVPPLRALVPPARVIDKFRYSPFTEQALPDLLRQRRIDTLVITGGETDVCVLAAVLDAVDRGYRVVLAGDALCSTSDEAHDSLLALYANRFSQQIEVAASEEILATWS